MTDDYRVKQLERDVANLEKKAEVIPVLETQITNMGREIGEMKTTMKDGFAELKEDGKATRRVTMAFAFTVAGTCVTAIVTLLAAGVI